jgi:hypothetical protein
MAAINEISFHDHIARKIAEAPGLFLVHAPRGFGKTRILSTVKHLVGPASVRVSGRDGRVAHEQLLEIARRFEAGSGEELTILVDDVDHLLQDAAGEDFASEEGGEPDRDDRDGRLRTLWRLKRHVTSEERRLCMSTSAPPLTLADYRPDYSEVFLQAASFEITAGEVAWQERVREIFSLLDPLPRTVEIWGESCPVDRTLLDEWCAVTQDLTAGHTTLLDPAVGLFFRLLDAALVKRPDAVEEVDDKRVRPELAYGGAVLKAIRADLTRTGVPYIRKRLASLTAGPQPQGLEALSYLRRIAQEDSGGSETEVPGGVEERLRTEGLVYLDIGKGRLRVVGELIREQVLEELQAPQKRTRHRVTVQLLDDSTKEFELPARLLELFEYLAAHSGEYVSTTDLVRVSGLNDEASVRTALHRLIRELKKSEVGGILENAYGKGYRLLLKSYSSDKGG